MTTKPVGIFGQQRHGKTSLAHKLAHDLNQNSLGSATSPGRKFAVRSLIGQFRESFLLMTGMTRTELENWKLKDEKPPGWLMTVREALRHVGTEGWQAVCPDIHINTVLQEPGMWVFDDGRRLREAERNKSIGGINVLIFRGWKFVNQSEHETEKEMRIVYHMLFDGANNVIGQHPLFDFVAVNTGPLTGLYDWSYSHFTGIYLKLTQDPCHGPGQGQPDIPHHIPNRYRPNTDVSE